MKHAAARWLYAGTVFVSAFALFLVQPIIARQVLPWFGGSAAVWSVCMVFFQTVLLGGYGYAHAVVERLSPRGQLMAQALLLLTSLLSLPILANPHWKPMGEEMPTVHILGLLFTTVGLPYFCLSTTGPLVQAWASRVGLGQGVYRLFSLSNLASLGGLVAYPFLVEPHLSLRIQAQAWSALYVVYAALGLLSALHFARRGLDLRRTARPSGAPSDDPGAPTLRQQLSWVLPAALASTMLLAITNHLTQNVASIPFLWIVPLSIYLLSFVLCFESDRWYRRRLYLPLLWVFSAACALELMGLLPTDDLRVIVPLYGATLFVLCMFLHGELARRRPNPRHLTRFYLMVSVGGTLGGVSVALLAPLVLPGYYEMSLSLALTAVLALYLFRQRQGLVRVHLGVAGLCTAALAMSIHSDMEDQLSQTRNFYGTLTITEFQRRRPPDLVRTMFHGAVKHGEQFQSAERRGLPTSYYGRSAGIGLAMDHFPPGQRRVGLIGLGVGTLATYGHTGDHFSFYEINSAVLRDAQRHFSYLRDTAAQIDHILGDARLSLERQPPQRFDVLAVDAFSGDAVPAHLLTREALEVYQRHLKDQGILAFHITNRFLDLSPVLANLAHATGMHAVQIRDENDDPMLRDTDWVLMARDPSVIQQAPWRHRGRVLRPVAGHRLWTDDYSNLFDVLR